MYNLALYFNMRVLNELTERCFIQNNAQVITSTRDVNFSSLSGKDYPTEVFLYENCSPL